MPARFEVVMKRLTVTSEEPWALDPEAVDLAEAATVIDEPLLQRVLDYWLSRRRDGLPPLRADIEPRDLGPDILPLIVMFDCVERDGRADCRYRLVGTTLVDRLGLDATGTYMRDSILDPNHAEQLVRHTHLPVQTGLPVFSHGTYIDTATGLPRLNTKRLSVPLRPRGNGPPLSMACQLLVPEGLLPPTIVQTDPVYRSYRFVRFTEEAR